MPDQSGDEKLWKVTHVLHEPAAINAAQFLGNAAAAASGLLAALGGMPTILNAQIGAMAVGVGLTLLVGGSLGAIAVLTGTWWLERISLLIVAVGWVSLLPAVISRAMAGPAAGNSYAIWLVVALLAVALSDIFKRYRRIDWAYLDPTR